MRTLNTPGGRINISMTKTKKYKYPIKVIKGDGHAVRYISKTGLEKYKTR